MGLKGKTVKLDELDWAVIDLTRERWNANVFSKLTTHGFLRRLISRGLQAFYEDGVLDVAERWKLEYLAVNGKVIINKKSEFLSIDYNIGEK